MKLKSLDILDFKMFYSQEEYEATWIYTNCEVECRDKYELIDKIEKNKILHLTDLDDNKECYVNGKYVLEFELEEE